MNERIQLKGTLQNFLRPLTVSLCDDAKRSGGQPLVLGQLSPVDLRQYLTQMDSRRFELDLPNGTAIVFTVTWEAAGAASASGAGAPSALEKMMANAAARSGQTPGHQRSCSGGSSGGLGLGAGALRSPTQSARSPPAAAGLMRGGKGGDSDRKGQLYVRVHSAKNLKAADLNFRSDPYVIANFGGTTAKTTVVKKTLSPTWEQTLDLGVHTVAAITSQPLNLKVYDEDQKRLREAFSSSDDLLGECSVRVDALEHDEKKSFNNVTLSQKGTISFTVSFKVLGKSASLPNPEKLAAPGTGGKGVKPAQAGLNQARVGNVRGNTGRPMREGPVQRCVGCIGGCLGGIKDKLTGGGGSSVPQERQPPPGRGGTSPTRKLAMGCCLLILLAVGVSVYMTPSEPQPPSPPSPPPPPPFPPPPSPPPPPPPQQNQGAACAAAAAKASHSREIAATTAAIAAITATLATVTATASSPPAADNSLMMYGIPAVVVLLLFACFATRPSRRGGPPRYKEWFGGGGDGTQRQRHGRRRRRWLPLGGHTPCSRVLWFVLSRRQGRKRGGYARGHKAGTAETLAVAGQFAD